MPRRGMAHNSPNPHNRQSLNTARQKAISCCADSAHEVIYSIDYNHKSFQPITGQTQRQSSNDRFASVFRPWCNLQHQLLWAYSVEKLLLIWVPDADSIPRIKRGKLRCWDRSKRRKARCFTSSRSRVTFLRITYCVPSTASSICPVSGIIWPRSTATQAALRSIPSC